MVASRVGSSQRCGSLPPVSSVVPGLALVLVPAGRRVEQRLHAGHVERPVAAVLVDRLVDGRLEAGEVDDQLRVD